MAIVAHIFRYRNMGQTLSTLKILRHVLWKSGAGLVEASGWRDGCAVTAGSCGLPLVSYAAQSASSDVSVWAFVGTHPKYWSFSFSISPSNEYSGLISFRIDWFELLIVQGILKRLLQHHSLETSVLWCSAFLTVQLSHLYMTGSKWT